MATCSEKWKTVGEGEELPQRVVMPELGFSSRMELAVGTEFQAERAGS